MNITVTLSADHAYRFFGTVSLALALSLCACGGSSSSGTTLNPAAPPTGTSPPTGGGVTVPIVAPVTPPVVPAPPISGAPNPPVVANGKSIGAWVTCTGTADDTTGTMQAFAAAKNGAFTLLVDCPVRLHSGLAVDRTVFIDNGTSVRFTGAGKFFVDNMFHPAFVIANSSNITLTDWNVEWDGAVPSNPNFGGYELNGQFVATPGSTQPAGAFNDLVLTPWLTGNRSITFDETQGWVKSVWVGGVNPAAVFFITGDSSAVAFTGMKLYVPAATGGSGFMPMAFSLSANWKSGQTVTGKTPETTQYAMVPHGITFSGIDLDGTYMGWQGNLQDSMFENITSHRYADLQDAGGGTVGGIGKWFPPPHLFYLNTHATDHGLDNLNIHFSNITDEGVRVGVARDKDASQGLSGYANSLKLGCSACSVDNYVSHRPDGFMDVLDSDGLTVSNVTATFDSLFINNLFPSGLRFPGTRYSHVSFENVQMTDTAEITIHGPIGNATGVMNDTLVLANFKIGMSTWAGADLPLPTITGKNSSVALNFAMSVQSTGLAFLQKAGATLTLQNSPARVRAGASTLLTWSSQNAGPCTAGGAWTGSLGGSGSRAVAVGAAGNYDFNLNCQSASTSSSTTTRVLAQ